MIAPNIIRPYKQQASITFNTSKEEVWSILKDFNRVYSWAPGVKESYAVGSKRQEVGAGRHCDLADFGQIQEYITRWDEGTGFVYDVTALGPLVDGISSWWLTEQAPNHTELNVTFGYQLRYGILGKAMHQMVMKKKLRSSLQETLESLKNRVERGELVRPLIKAVV